jgi:chemotaxis receptor (MCP) glutamine deamidase CheD
MTTLLPILPHFPKHCAAGRNLHVRSDLLQRPVHIRASRKKPFELENRISLHIGDIAASHAPVVLDTLLGSCVAVCLYDPLLGAGGMNHILLSSCPAGEKNARCGVHAMELLINELMNLGGDRRRFIAKAFGGANVIEGVKMPPIGDRNAHFVRAFLATERIPLVAERLGGNHAVHLYFRTDTGKVNLRSINGSALPKIIAAEKRYQKPGPHFKSFGEITLF